MTRKIYISIFLICSFLVCCTCQNSENKHRTKIFSNYLQNTFQQKLNNENNIYFVITSGGCPTCKTSLLSYLQEQTKNVKLIVTQDWEIQLPDHVELLFDEEANINRMDMRISGTYALFIKNGKIVKSFSINPPNIPQLDEEIKLFLGNH